MLGLVTLGPSKLGLNRVFWLREVRTFCIRTFTFGLFQAQDILFCKFFLQQYFEFLLKSLTGGAKEVQDVSDAHFNSKGRFNGGKSIYSEWNKIFLLHEKTALHGFDALLTPPSWVRIWLLDNTKPAKRDFHHRKCVPVKEYYWSIRVKLKYFSGTKSKNVNPRIFLRCDERSSG